MLFRSVDFHALRKTYSTLLQVAGFAPAMVQKLMRHSDYRLTLDNYTDTSHFPVAEQVERLTFGQPSLTASLETGKNGQNLATNGQTVGNNDNSEIFTNVCKAAPYSVQTANLPSEQTAERVGFEPTVPCGTPDFESGTIGHSVTSPEGCLREAEKVDYVCSRVGESSF